MRSAGGFEVPALVRERALSGGGTGERWLRELPEVVADLARRWGLRVGAAYRGGTAGYVVAAQDRSGRDCVLKVAMALHPDELVAFDHGVLVHELADGRGCAALLAHDRTVPAMLLERLGPNLDELRMPIPQLLETIALTLRSFWRPIGDVDLPTGAQKAAWLAETIVANWEQLGRPCDRQVIDRAVGCCEERGSAFDPDRAVLTHGDAHGWNTVEAGGGRFKFVDPEGLRSEPAHDLGVPMREYNESLLAGETSRLTRQRAEQLAAWCDADPEAVWQWGFIERVSTGLLSLRHFDGDDGLAFLEVASRSR